MPLTGEGYSRKYTKFEQFYERKDPSFSMRIEIIDPDEWNKYLDLTSQFNEKYGKLFREVVYQAHKYLIRVTPMDSGRLRGGWTAVLNRHRIDYSMAFMDTSLIETKSTIIDPSAIMEGVALSSALDTPLDVTVINNVPYAQYLEFGTSKMQGKHFTQRAMYKSEHIMKQALEDWFKEIAVNGNIIEPKPIEDVTA